MIENILILDTETTGLDPRTGSKIIEIAVVLFNLKNKSILQCFSTLLPCDENPCEKINHISPAATQCTYPFLPVMAVNEEEVWDNPDVPPCIIYTEENRYFMEDVLPRMAKASQAIVAHNAEFDRGFVGALPCCTDLAHLKWICTKKNFTWPVHLTRLRLEDICNAMGVPYMNAHRAIHDCLLLAHCFQKVSDLEARFANL